MELSYGDLYDKEYKLFENLDIVPIDNQCHLEVFEIKVTLSSV